MAQLSRDLPRIPIRAWSGHRRDVLHFRAEADDKEKVIALLGDRLPEVDAIAFDHGVVAILEPAWPKQESISRRLEDHKALWLQPLQYQAGWEHYDVLSLDDALLQTYLAQLLKRYPLEIVSRGSVDETALLSAFFVPINPILDVLTAKQEEALLAAWRGGYYTQPRTTTTLRLAQALGVSRSAFEERLRKAENLLVQGVAPSLAAYDRDDHRPVR